MSEREASIIQSLRHLFGAFVEVKLMNHSMKGITQLDFDLAKKIDEFIFWNPKNEDSSLEGTPTDPRFAYIKYNK